MDEKDIVLSDEAIAEQEKEAEADSGKLRAKVVAELGLTEDDTNKEFIDKLVERESNLRKGFGKLLGDYKTLKTKAKPAQQSQQQQQQTPQLDAEKIREQTEATVTERLEQRDLDEMEYPDDIKAEIKKIAKAQGVSVRKAEKDPYISFLVGQAQAAGRIDEAAVPHTQRSTTTKTEKVPTFDMATEEGRKAYDTWKASKKK
jgi:hypothetical protein